VATMSVAFTREESAETAAEVELPDRPISPHPNLVTASGLEALANAMAEYRAAYNAAHQIEDATERRRAVALASREMRYFADRLRTAQVIPPPVEFDGHCHVGDFYLSIGRRAHWPQTGKSMAWRFPWRLWTPPESTILGERDNALCTLQDRSSSAYSARATQKR